MVFIEVCFVVDWIIVFADCDEPARLEFVRLPEIGGVVMKEG